MVTRTGLIAGLSPWPRQGSVWELTRFVRVGRRPQVQFAAATCQALDAGLEIDEAIRLAASVVRSRKFAYVLRLVAQNVRAGYSISDCFRLTGFRVGDSLLNALDVGEDRGCIAAELSDFARRAHPALAAKSPKRPAAVQRFAGTLAGLLSRHKLTPSLVADAGRVVGGSRRFTTRDRHGPPVPPGRVRKFTAVIEQVVEDLEGGAPFNEALARHPRWFDEHFCGCVGVSESREQLCRTLKAIASPGIR